MGHGKIRVEDRFPRLDKTVFKICHSFEEAEEDDRAYWQAQSSDLKFQSLEFIRQSIYGYDPATERFQRSIEFVKRNRS